jgi:hypothetical protein
MRDIVTILYVIASIGSFVAILHDPGTLYIFIYLFNCIIFGLSAISRYTGWF